MTTSDSTDIVTMGVDPESDEQIVPFVHGLGGEVDVAAYGADGHPVGVLAVMGVSAMEVEVMVLPGTVTRLTAGLRPEQDNTP